jgi:molybdopterin-guanine dinucleotide biosynthesis protein A
MISRVDATLLVLAGGMSTRMGRPKAWLEVGDTKLIHWMVARLSPAFSEVIVSFAEPEQLQEHVPYRLVFDRKGEAGPLAGLEAGLTAAREEVTFVLAVDMPYVTVEVAEMAVAAARTSDAAIPRIGDRPEPVCAAYRRSALAAISAALEAGEFKLTNLAERLDVTWLEGLDSDLFRSLNTPDDYERFRESLAPGAL